MNSHTGIQSILDEIRYITDKLGRPISVMEVCGTHTMAIHRHGLAMALPAHVRLRSGPGCPVCVTSSGYIDAAVSLAMEPDVTVTTFGDMVRVPGTAQTLESARAQGGSVRIVQSPLDAVDFAAENPETETVFLAIGFETTAPTIAAAVLMAEKRGISNFRLLPGNKVVPPALHALLDQPDLCLDALLLPGHVSAILGITPYEFIPRDYSVPCSVAGFEPGDIVIAIRELVGMIADNRSEIVNSYERVVRRDGNVRAKDVMDTVFQPVDDTWRGFGLIPASGLGVRPAYTKYDICAARGMALEPGEDPPGCRCGDVVRGLAEPTDCGLFGTECAPDRPVGPCMVSSEGTCAAHYKYGSGPV